MNITGPTKRNQTISPGQNILYYASDYDVKADLVPEGGKMHHLEINLHVDYYSRLLAGYSALQEQFVDQILQNKNSCLHSSPLPMTLPMKWIVNTIGQCARTGVLKRLFLEAKILELLMLQVEHAEQENQQTGGANKSHELEAFYQFKSILEGSLDKPPTIKHLAKMVGIMSSA